MKTRFDVHCFDDNGKLFCPERPYRVGPVSWLYPSTKGRGQLRAQPYKPPPAELTPLVGKYKLLKLDRDAVTCARYELGRSELEDNYYAIQDRLHLSHTEWSQDKEDIDVDY